MIMEDGDAAPAVSPTDAPRGGAPAAGARRPLSAAAARALAEAAARREKAAAGLPTEVNGRGGLEPVRYGDWEVKGIASDF